MKKNIDFTVLICIKDALIYVQKCLNSIIKHTHKNFVFILVNDNSNDETSSLLDAYSKKYDNIRLINNETNLGYTRSLNIGLKLVTTNFVIVLNSDIIVTPNWSKKLISPMLKHKDVGIISPLSNAALWQSVPDIFDKNGKYSINNLPAGFSIDSFGLEIEKQFQDQYTEVCIVNGFCMAIRKSLFNKVGYFDEKNFPVGYGEETDFCIRSGKLGFKLLVKLDTYIYHYKSRSFGQERRNKLIDTGNNKLNSLYGSNNISRLYVLMKKHIVLNSVRNKIRSKYDFK